MRYSNGLRLVALTAALLACAETAWAQRGPKVLLVYDMEGTSALATPGGTNFGNPDYQATREALTEDVNAAIRGLLRGGAREVVITDGHGSGNPEPDYDTTRLPQGARFEIRDAPYDAYIDVVDGSFDAVVTIAFHARAGTPGFISHTYFGHVKWGVADFEMNEAMIVAASAARFGVPLILVTGDDVLQQQVAAFSPRTEYVVVKTAQDRAHATPRARDEVSRDIEAAAERAMRGARNIPAWRPAAMRGSFESRFGYSLPEHAALAINYPGARVVDDRTIGLTAPSFLDAYLAFRALALFTAPVVPRMVYQAVPEVEGGPQVIQRARERLGGRLTTSFTPAGAQIDITPTTYRSRHGYR